jgi:hypothetical protein
MGIRIDHFGLEMQNVFRNFSRNLETELKKVPEPRGMQLTQIDKDTFVPEPPAEYIDSVGAAKIRAMQAVLTTVKDPKGLYNSEVVKTNQIEQEHVFYIMYQTLLGKISVNESVHNPEFTDWLSNKQNIRID